jgi:carbon storage regulator CsrA
MLVLTRRLSEAVIIGGHVEVQVTGISGQRVRLAFKAAPEIPIVRAELLRRPGRSRRPSGGAMPTPRRCA